MTARTERQPGAPDAKRKCVYCGSQFVAPFWFCPDCRQFNDLRAPWVLPVLLLVGVPTLCWLVYRAFGWLWGIGTGLAFLFLSLACFQVVRWIKKGTRAVERETESAERELQQALSQGRNPEAGDRASPEQMEKVSQMLGIVGGLTQDVPESSLVRAARAGDMDEVARLVDSGHDVNAAWPLQDMTALRVATENQNENMVTFLLRLGADPCRGSPLLDAVLARDKTIARLLLDHGAPPDLVADGRWMSPLQVAREQGDATMVSLLSQFVGGNSGEP